MTTGTVAKTDKRILCKLHYKKIRVSIDLPALSEIFAGLKSASILGGNKAKADTDRFSYWAAEPKEIFEFKTGQKEPFGKLQKVLGKYKLHPDTRLKTQDSRLRTQDSRHRTQDTRLKTQDSRLRTQDSRLRTQDSRLKTQDSRTELPKGIFCGGWVGGPADLDNIDFSQIRCNMDKDYYMQTVEKIKRYIYDGEVYQINFSQRFECDYDARPIELLHWQNHYNPSGYAAYIDGGSFYIVSASPEMFITIANGVIQTKPIKGTRRRISETARKNSHAKQINAKNFNELLHSKKEQAELNMIIDLERNDVAKICKPGTRKVIQPRTIESYPTVFHAVATVAGQLRKEITFCDILRAMFPGGSITGAPKIRSMEIIDETEPTSRGVYTGSIGFIGIDGCACLNIAIRTIIITNRKSFAQTGGGIVADSDPQAEWDETITKARALLAGIKATQKSKQRVIDIKKTNKKSKAEYNHSLTGE